MAFTFTIGPSRSLLKNVDAWIRNFVWSADIDKRKLVIMAWHAVCKLVENGGLGIRPIRAINSAAMLKLYWNIYSSDMLWAEFMKAKFMTKLTLVS